MADERIFISVAWSECSTRTGRFKSFPKIGSLQIIRMKWSKDREPWDDDSGDTHLAGFSQTERFFFSRHSIQFTEMGFGSEEPGQGGFADRSFSQRG